MDILDAMNERDNICNYLDMPLQHISDPMLKSMRRGITRDKTLKLIDTIRERVPGIALRTTLISGYPGETEQDHQELLRFVERSEEHTSELQSLMRISYAVFCLKKKIKRNT